MEGDGNIAVEGAVSGGSSGTLPSEGSSEVWGAAVDTAVQGVDCIAALGVGCIEALEVGCIAASEAVAVASEEVV